MFSGDQSTAKNEIIEKETLAEKTTKLEVELKMRVKDLQATCMNVEEYKTRVRDAEAEVEE